MPQEKLLSALALFFAGTYLWQTDVSGYILCIAFYLCDSIHRSRGWYRYSWSQVTLLMRFCVRASLLVRCCLSTHSLFHSMVNAAINPTHVLISIPSESE